MNHTARPDGAICLEREPVDRLPNVVALSNRGDDERRVDPLATMPALRAQIDVPTMRPARLRAIGNAYRGAFAAPGADDVAYNRPYLGGHETQIMGPMLRALEPLGRRPRPGQEPRGLHFGAWQNEFLREFLLGPDSTAAVLQQPGGDWVGPTSRTAWSGSPSACAPLTTSCERRGSDRVTWIRRLGEMSVGRKDLHAWTA